jgi:hypothetical protein
MPDKRLDITFTRPTTTSEDCNKSMTLWPAKEPAPQQPSQPAASGSQTTQGGSQGGSGSQGSSQPANK